MAELPDLEVFARNLDKLYAGKKLQRIKIKEDKKLKDNPLTLYKTLKGKTLKAIYRDGKELRFQFNSEILLGMHLMLTGDLFIFDRKNNHPFTIIEFYFEDGLGLSLNDRLKNATIKLNPINKRGVDALEPALNLRYLKEALKRKTAVKNVLMDQNIIRGIGNSYSDEILWQSKISPFSVSSAIPDIKIKELLKAIKSILKNASHQIYKHYPNKINDEVKEYLKIHSKQQTHSPTGFAIIKVSKGGRKTYYTEEQLLYK